MASRGLLRNCNKVINSIKKAGNISTYNLMDETDLSLSWFEKNRGYLLHKFSYISYEKGMWTYHKEENVPSKENSQTATI